MSASRILVVDSKNTSETVKSLLAQNAGHDWEVDVVTNQKQALQALDTKPYNLLISEIVMPEMDGLDFFKTAKEKHPTIIRIMETANENREFLVKASELAHIVIPSNCEKDSFNEIIKNTMSLQEIIANKDILKKLTSIKSLPSPPEVYNKLVSTLQNEDCSTHQVAEIIKNDIAITAKLLQMINSAFFGMKTHVESPMHAVNLLGIDTVKSIVLTSGIFHTIREKEFAGFSVDEMYRQSMAVGAATRHLANVFGFRTKDIEDALMAGLLHDIGKLLMITNFKKELADAKKIAQTDNILIGDAIRQIIGISDAELGAHLLSLWNLPLSILEAVAYHNQPSKSAYKEVNTLTAVHLAYGITTDKFKNVRNNEQSFLDIAYIERLGLQNNLPQFKNFCLAASE